MPEGSGKGSRERGRERGRFSHLFSGRYKSLIVDDRSPQYLRAVSDYVHLNPARAGLLDSGEPLESWRWSSYPDYLRPAGKRALWLRTDRVFSEHQVRKDTVAGRRLFADVMEKKRLSPDLDDESELALIRRGWRMGSEEFVAWLHETMVGEKEVGERHPKECREADEQKAGRLIAEGLQKAGWLAARLLEERKGHPWKIAMARQLRDNTPMTLRWIAKNLHMGQWTHVSNLLAQTPNNQAN